MISFLPFRHIDDLAIFIVVDNSSCHLKKCHFFYTFVITLDYTKNVSCYTQISHLGEITMIGSQHCVNRNNFFITGRLEQGAL